MYPLNFEYKLVVTPLTVFPTYPITALVFYVASVTYSLLCNSLTLCYPVSANELPFSYNVVPTVPAVEVALYTA